MLNIIKEDNETINFNALSTEIFKIIKVRGFAHIKQPLSQNAFEALVYQLGSIELRTDLVVDPKMKQLQQASRSYNKINRPSVYQADALAFHTDRPTFNLLGWYCVQQDEVDGAILLLDTINIGDYFTPAEISLLSRVKVSYMMINPTSNEEEVFYEPLISKYNTTYRVFYIPWNLSAHYNREQTALLENFSEYVAYKQRTELLTVRLAPQECLFIYNHRMLHSRGRLPENSRRHLIRLYIRAPLMNL